MYRNNSKKKEKKREHNVSRKIFVEFEQSTLPFKFQAYQNANERAELPQITYHHTAIVMIEIRKYHSNLQLPCDNIPEEMHFIACSISLKMGR